MKKLFLGLGILIFCICSCAVKKNANNADELTLKRRLAEFFSVCDSLDLDKMLDYHYPKIYTLIPRSEMLKFMEENYKDPSMSFEIDSIVADSIYPVFSVNNGLYAKIRYSMLLRASNSNLIDTMNIIVDTNFQRITDDPPSRSTYVQRVLEEKYGKENVQINKTTGSLKIHVTHNLLSVKDENSKEWTFLTIEEYNLAIEKLFSQEVLQKLASYN